MDFEYAIIGGGPAGYTAGMLLAQAGKSVVIFEKDKLGGTCLNRGCIPTKSLLHSSEIYAKSKQLLTFGISLQEDNFDFSKVIEKKDITVEKIRKSLELAVKNSGAKVVYAEAKIISKNLIKAADEEYNVGKIILASGAKPRELKGLEFDGKFILSSDDILNINSLPKSVLIVGSGAIGIEWSRIFNNFGVETAIVEKAEHLIPIADIEVSKRIERIFKQNKIKFYLNDSIEKIENNVVTLSSGVVLEPDFILSAVGRVPIKESGEFSECIGDACNEIQLAHYAIQQAKCVAKNIKCNKNLIPSVIYGEPEIAWVGLREQDCDENCEKVVLPITALGKSWCDDSTDGFIKIIIKDNVIVGAHIVSKEASALVHQFLIAIQNKLTLESLREICFAHPTYSEGFGEIIMRV